VDAVDHEQSSDRLIRRYFFFCFGFFFSFRMLLPLAMRSPPFVGSGKIRSALIIGRIVHEPAYFASWKPTRRPVIAGPCATSPSGGGAGRT
jgi:hypothetical protein